MTEHAVVIAGGGPTGMMLAGELALAGVDVAIVERRVDRALESSRAGGLHARTIEVLEQRGIAERFLARGKVAQVASFSGIGLDISDVPSRHPYGLALWQREFEEILAGWIGELPVTIRGGVEVSGFAQDEDGVDVALSDGSTLRAQYLVGCDGGRSVVRKAAGIHFPGADASIGYLIAEAQMVDPELGVQRDAIGTHAIGPREGGFGIVVREDDLTRTGEPTLEDVRAALTGVRGTDYGLHSPTWISSFTDATRQAETYRAGRVLLAGDAAHIHSPMGGQGLSLGIQDAVNLGWKLASVARGTAPDTLLDSYEAERHPVTARVLRTTMAATALGRADDRSAALRETTAALLELDEPRHLLGAQLSGLDIHYDLGPGHPLVGRRMPDLDLETALGPVRVSTLLHDAKPLLLDYTGSLDAPARVGHVVASCAGGWALPVIGPVAPPSAVLVRPDGYVAWVGEGTDAGLTDALARWCGR